MATIEQMIKNVELFEQMTLSQLKHLVISKRIDTHGAVMQAAKIEKLFLSDFDRDTRIAVFLSGLMANLVSED